MTGTTPASDLNPRELAAHIPDIPRWVETRGALLSGRARLIGPASGDPVTAVVVHEDWELGSVLGRPAQSAIREVAASATEILAIPENYKHVAAALPHWIGELATIHALPAQEAMIPGTPAAGGESPTRTLASSRIDGTVRLLVPGELDSLTHLPDDLRDELTDALRSGALVFTALADGLPVAFCYAGAVTQSWWDISVDTVESHRRRGFASLCVAAAIRHFEKEGKRPVWGSYESNFASRRLAERLGFEAVDTLVVFRAS